MIILLITLITNLNSVSIISDIIKSFDSKTSCDLDGISLKLLKVIAVSISLPLAHIFNLSLDKVKFPEKLKLSRIVPVFKSGDPKLCDNYRPISLVNTLSKVLEKIVALKLTIHLQINDLLYKHQYGFLKGRSTKQNLLHVAAVLYRWYVGSHCQSPCLSSIFDFFVLNYTGK